MSYDPAPQSNGNGRGQSLGEACHVHDLMPFRPDDAPIWPLHATERDDVETLPAEIEAMRRIIGFEVARLNESVPQAPKCIPARYGQGQVRIFGRSVHCDAVYVNQQEIARGRAQHEHRSLVGDVRDCREQQRQRLKDRAIS